LFVLYFQNETVFNLSLASPEGVKLVAALKPWAEAKIITWFFSESFEEDI
jgi:hypothetical protein